MNCIVLGAGGQLGREWMHSLNQLNQQNVPAIINKCKGYRSHELDITSEQQVIKALEGESPDVVINCAAYTKVDQAEEDQEAAETVNSLAVKFLAEECAARNIKLVHYSTDYVFPGKREDRERLPQGYPEDHPTDPVNWYGATKLKGEEAIRASGAEHLILRVSWLCGQFGSNFVTTMLRLAEERDQLDLVNDQWGSPTFTEHVVEQSLALLAGNESGTYHITSQGMITWYDYAKKIFSLSGKQVQVNPVTSDAFETKAKRPHFSKLYTEKLAAVAGTNTLQWEEGLTNLLDKLN